MSVLLKQFNGESVTPKDDARLYDHVIGDSGVISGCEVTHLGSNQLQIAAGWGIVKGRIFVVSQETINATVSDSGTKKGRLLIKIDTANPTTPISFETQMAASLPALEQEEINESGTAYELPLAEYDISTIAISNLVDVTNQIAGVSIPDGAVTEGKIVAGAVTEDKLAAGAVTTNKLGTITEITMDTGDKIKYDAATNTFRLAVNGCVEVQLAPIVFGTSEAAPGGIYPKGTLYLTHE